LKISEILGLSHISPVKIATPIRTTAFNRTSPVVWTTMLIGTPSIVWTTAFIGTPSIVRAHVAFVVATPVITVTPESVIPVPAVMPAVLHITITLDLFQTVSAYRWRKIHIHDTAPGTFVVLRPVPGTLTENEKVISIVNDVIWSSIGYREAVVIQIDEIGPDCHVNFRIT
jgi:hypothetical protein